MSLWDLRQQIESSIPVEFYIIGILAVFVVLMFTYLWSYFKK